VNVPAVTHWRAASHAVGANVGTGQPEGSASGGQYPQASPHAFPAQPHAGGGAGHGGGGPATQAPAPSQWPSWLGIMHGGTALRHGGSMVHSAPHAFPAQAAAAHIPSVHGAQRPDGSQAFTTAVSTQPASPGGHAVQPSPHAFPAHGSYAAGVEPSPQPGRGEAAASTSASGMARRTACPSGPIRYARAREASSRAREPRSDPRPRLDVAA
jgi:hypothetical protein